MQIKKILNYYYKLTASICITIYYAILVIFLIIITRKQEIFFKYSKKWSQKLLNICRIKVNVINNFEKKDKSPLIYISNHSSLFDIPIVITACQDNIAIMYKKELEKIPIFGWCLKVSPFIAVKREDPKSSMKSLEEAIKAVQGKYSVLIFPEGTRSEDGTIGEFKRGAFMLATRSGKPILPMVIIGSNKILPKGLKTINSGEVKVIYTNIIQPLNESNRLSEIALMNQVRNLIIEEYKQHLS